jgi:hypothetical protein
MSAEARPIGRSLPSMSGILLRRHQKSPASMGSKWRPGVETRPFRRPVFRLKLDVVPQKLEFVAQLAGIGDLLLQLRAECFGGGFDR